MKRSYFLYYIPFLEEGSAKNAIRIAQLVFKFLFQFFLPFELYMIAFLFIFYAVVSFDGGIGQTVFYFQNPLELKKK